MSAQVPASSIAAVPPSLSFLFWNLGRNFPIDYLGAIVQEHRPDVLMLAEVDSEVRAALPALLGPEFRVHTVHSFAWAVHAAAGRFVERENNARISLGHLRTRESGHLTVGLVHLPSPLYYRPNEQAAFARDIVRLIGRHEAAAGHDRTLVVGDFNMNPFEEGMVLADAFHAVMSRDVAARHERVVVGTRYKMFFNPMWRLLANGHTPASYYYGSEAHLAYFWHMYDQVLVRPALLPRFPEARTALLTTTSIGSLLSTHGRPNPKISDHLPLKFHLDSSSAA